MIIREFLRQMGHDNVDEAHDGETALQFARSKKYAWIISDLHMQPMNGMDLLRQLRAEQGSRVPPFIFVTGENKWSSQTDARGLGAHAFIQKPQRTAMLKERIEAIFGPGGIAAIPEPAVPRPIRHRCGRRPEKPEQALLLREHIAAI